MPTNVSLAIFCFKLSHYFWHLKSSEKGKKLKNFVKKSDFNQIPKKASQPNQKHLLVSNNEFLFGLVTFSL